MLLVLLALLGCGGTSPQVHQASLPNQAGLPDHTREISHSAAWLGRAGFGVMLDFAGKGEGWQNQINALNVEAFAHEAALAKARYVVFTMGVNRGFYAAPNATYEKLLGVGANERCSRRDVPMELSQALEPRGIKLLLYMTSRAPRMDPLAIEKLGDVADERSPAPQGFINNWSSVIREWSLRYGKRVSGWWFDGAYAAEGWSDLTKTGNWQTWAAAARAGNPESILAFNSGSDPGLAFRQVTSEQDYTAGEQNDLLATPSTHPAPAGVQWHVSTYLGSSWSHADSPRIPTGELVDYARKVVAQGGAITLDVGITPDGHIYAPQLSQLEAVGAALN